MIGFLQILLSRMTAVALLGGVALALTKNSAQQQILRLAVGMLLTLTLLTSVGGGAWQASLQTMQQTMGELHTQILCETETATNRNKQITESSVTGVMIQYMTDRARQLGVSLTANLQMATDNEGILIVQTAYLVTESQDKQAIAAVQTMLAEECGIAKEKQQWTYQP